MIEIKNITVRIGDTEIISKLSYTFEENKKYVITGPSGCGKSTFLYALCGLEKIKTGEIKIFSKSLKNKKLRNDMSIVFQNLLLNPNMSIKENIKSTVFNVDDKEMHNLMNYFNITKNLNTYIRELSGGQQQRIAIIRELLRNKKIMLFDEPTSHLDHHNRDLFYDKINSLSDKLIIVITHDDKCEKLKEYQKISFSEDKK